MSNPTKPNAVGSDEALWTIGGLMRPRREKAIPVEHPSLPYVGLEHIEAHTTRLLGTALSSEMRSMANRFYPGDLLYSRLRPYLNKVWLADREGLCSAEFIVIPGNEIINVAFLGRCLNAAGFVAFANSLNAGDRPRVDFDQISVFPLPQFSLSRQRRIVAKIEELFSELDKGLENLRQARAQLAVYRQALLKHAFAGQLTAAWRATHAAQLESAAQLLSRIRAELPPELERSETPEKNECGWLKLSLREITPESLIGLVRASALQNGDGRGFSYIKMDRIDMCGRVDVAPEVFVECNAGEVERFALRAGDILFNTRNSLELVGKNGLVRKSPPAPAVFNNNLMRIRTVSAVLPAFLNYQMCAPDFRNKMEKVKKATTSVAAVYGRDLWPLVVVIPSTAEQEQIVVELDRQLDAIEQMEADIETNLQKAEALRQAILKKAFAGELVPPDPADEPAATLLARLRTERAAAPKLTRRQVLLSPSAPSA